MKISIITVTLNSEKTIRDTLNSVLSQKYKNLEHIIVDGGSTDSTVSILKKYPNKNKKIIIKKNSSIYEAMNIGVKIAKGDFIGILNSDDIYQNDKVIGDIYSEIKKNPRIKIFIGNLIYFKDRDFYNIKREFNSINFKAWMLRFGIMPPHPSTFINKEVYQQNGYYNSNLKIASDFDFFFRTIYKRKIKFKIINKTLVRMRLGGVSGLGFSSFLKINNEIGLTFKNNYNNLNYLFSLFRLPSKLKQFFFINNKRLNKDFIKPAFYFDKQSKFIDNFNLIDSVKKIPFNKNFVLSAMNLAYLGSYAENIVHPFKDLYHWPDGIFAKKFINIKKIPGRDLLKKMIIPKEIKKILVMGVLSDRSKEYLENKFLIRVEHKELPFGDINKIKKKIIIKKNVLVLITLPTPKQEQYALYLTKNNSFFKIICIGGSVQMASREDKHVPDYLSNFEYIWRLRTDTLRRSKRLIKNYLYFYTRKIFSDIYTKVSFSFVDKLDS